MSSALRSVDLLHHRCDSAVGVVPLLLLPLKVVETKVSRPLQPPGSGLSVAQYQLHFPSIIIRGPVSDDFP